MRLRVLTATSTPSRQLGRLVALAWAVAVALGCRGAEVPPRGQEVEAPEQPTQVSTSGEAEAPAPISDDPVIQAIVALAVEDSQVDDHLDTLARDIGPRLSGTPQLEAAELWAIEQFERWGLEASREQWGEFSVVFERGKASGAMIRPERQELEIGTWAWTPGTRGQAGLEAGGPVRGQALRYPETAAELRGLRPYLRGAWIMIPHAFARPRGQLRQQIEGAFARAPIAGLVWAAGDPEDTRIQTHGEHELDPEDLPTQVEIRLRGDQHHALLERMAAGEYVELEFGVANRLLAKPTPVHNVIAELPGAELPQQRVIVGAHLDSWDGASGAVDNATGVATTMEAARLIAAACARTGRSPRRTLSFALWSGEEQGLLGSTAWVAAHGDRLEGISAVLVHDEGTNYISGLPVTPELHTTMKAVFEPVARLAPEQRPFALELVEGLPFEPSDSTPFLRAGVPAFFWAQSGRSDYPRYHHTQYDHAEAVIDEYQRHSALVVAIAAWQLAQLPELLDRHNLLPLPRRIMGVSLDETVVEGVERDSLAEAAGVQVDDRIVAIDGAAVATGAELVAAIQRGEPRKTVSIEREIEGERRRIELVFDWSGEPGEAERAARRAERRERFGPEQRPWDRDGDGDGDGDDASPPVGERGR
jgi:carboxypeptidase Q